jgi:hypothetical protein
VRMRLQENFRVIRENTKRKKYLCDLLKAEKFIHTCKQIVDLLFKTCQI